MKRQKILEKSLTLGVIILLIAAFIPSINAENFLTKEMTITKNLVGPTPRIEGTLGKNFWYISAVKITFLYSPDEVKELWYNIDGGEYQKYSDTFTISTEGKITVAWYYIDNNDMKHSGVTIFLKIDMSPPTVKISKVPGDNNVAFTAKAEDKISLVERVEFYLDDELQAVDNESPYTWTYEGTEAHMVYAKAYNMAGLDKDSEKISTPRLIITNFLQLIIELIQKIIYKTYY